VIAEIIPGCYDVDGKRILQPKKRHHFSGRPMGSFLSQPLKVVCHNMNEIRAFLVTCRDVSDREQFGVPDHWAAPEAFEQTRRAIATTSHSGPGGSFWISGTALVSQPARRVDTVTGTLGSHSELKTRPFFWGLF
jgi:hypothetical protein